MIIPLKILFLNKLYFLEQFVFQNKDKLLEEDSRNKMKTQNFAELCKVNLSTTSKEKNLETNTNLSGKTYLCFEY